MKHLTIIILLCLSNACFSSEKENFSVLGTWNFKTIKVVGDFRQTIPKDSSIVVCMSTFFGANVLFNCPGKTITFLQDNSIQTDLVDQETLNSFNFKYEVNYSNNNIIFSVILPGNSTTHFMPAPFATHNNIMIWRIDNYLEIELEKKD